MVLTDPIADMLTRIRNASRARHSVVEMPASKMKQRIAELLKKEGYISDFELTHAGTVQKKLKVTLRYRGARQPMLVQIKRVSKPGCRIYVTAQEVAALKNPIMTTVISTSKGLMTGSQAKEAKIGGEVILQVQ